MDSGFRRVTPQLQFLMHRNSMLDALRDWLATADADVDDIAEEIALTECAMGAILQQAPV